MYDDLRLFLTRRDGYGRLWRVLDAA